MRGAYLEVWGDLLGSVAVLAAAAVIALTGFRAADPIASAVIGVAILPRTWRLLREAVDVLLEATPKGSTWPRCAGTWSRPRRDRRARPARLDYHQRAAGALGPRGPGARRRRRQGPGRARRLPGRPFRHRALHLPARAARASRPRGATHR